MLTDILTFNQSAYTKMADHFLRTKGNLMVFGKAGSGKTEIALQRARTWAVEHGGYKVLPSGELDGVHCSYLNGSCLEPPDLIGLPVPGDNFTVKYLSPAFLPIKGVGDPRPRVLVVDEIDKCKPELQNPMLELFQFRSMNGRELNVQAIIATGNLPDEHAHSEPVSHALTNRCGIIQLKIEYDAWREWAISSGKVHSLIVAFLSKETGLLHKPNDSGDLTAYVSPSPRSWAHASNDLINSEGESIEWQYLLLASHVGAAAAAKFKVWLEHYRLVAPIVDALVQKGKEPNASMLDQQKTLVVAISAIGEIAKVMNETVEPSKKKKKAEQIDKLVTNIFPWLSKLPVDYQGCAIKSSITRQHVADYFVNLPMASDLVMKLGKSYVGGGR